MKLIDAISRVQTRTTYRARGAKADIEEGALHRGRKGQAAVHYASKLLAYLQDQLVNNPHTEIEPIMEDLGLQKHAYEEAGNTEKAQEAKDLLTAYARIILHKTHWRDL